MAVSAGSSPAITSVKDAAGNTWTELASVSYSTNVLVALFALDVPAGDGGTKPTLTVTITASGGNSIGMVLQEVSGLLAGNMSAMADGTPGTATGTASPTTLPSYASHAAGEYLVLVYGDEGNGTAWTKPSAYTGADGVNSSENNDIAIAYANSTGGTEAGQYTLSQSSEYGIILGAFKLAATAVPVYGAQQKAIRAQPPYPRPRGVYTGLVPEDTSSGTGQIQWNAGGPVRNPQAGPAFRQAAQPARIRVTPPARGRIASNPGGPVPAPPVIAIFRQATSPARARIAPPPRGRTASNPGGPVRNPVPPPVVRLPHGPAQAKLPPGPPRGRSPALWGVTLFLNPQQSPASAQRTSPARIRPALPPGAAPGAARAVPSPRRPSWPRSAGAGPREDPPRVSLCGRAYSHPGAPLRNPEPGPYSARPPALPRPGCLPRS